MREHELTTLLKVICFVVRNSITCNSAVTITILLPIYNQNLKSGVGLMGGSELLLTQILDQSVIFKKFRTTID